jgi:prepilin-type N-terminal cleavage/methylation domain-containing protein
MINCFSSTKAYAFTLLEMMIALVILSLIGAFSAVHIKKLVDVHRFESEVSNLFIALQEAQVLSSAYKTDVALDIYREKGKLHYQFSTDEPFASHQFNREKNPLAHTAAIRFKNKKITALHFDIFSGRIEPRGILTFVQAQVDDSKALWFDLQYGQLVKFSHREPHLVKQQIPANPTQ